MNETALLHIPDSSYSFALSKKELVVRLRVDRQDQFSNIKVLYNNKYLFHEGHKEKEMVKTYVDHLYRFYETTLQLDDPRVAYVFQLTNDEGSFYFSEDGITSDYDFSLGFYNFFQVPYINEIDLFRPVGWMKEAVFYQIFVDRFNEGATDKDRSYVTMPWGGKPTPTNFAGGDLKGIKDKLPYLHELGINAIYLTPIFKSPTNHKYDIINYYEIDPHFGTMADFDELIEAAHELGIKIVLDAVFNHGSHLGEQFQDVIEKGKDSPYYDWFIIRGDYPDLKQINYECFAECYYMPKWDTSNPEVQQFLIDVGTHWIKEHKIDGWRLDVADEVSHDFWRNFRRALKTANPEAVLIGENWHDSSPFLQGDQFDSIMNYAVTKAMLDYFARQRFTAEEMAERLNSILMRNKGPVNQMNLNLLDSHDTHRFLTEVGGSIDQLKAALAVLVVFMGTPCIYYGTEIGMEGGHDPDSRRTFDWDEANWPMDVWELTQSLFALKARPVLSDGDITIDAENGLLRIKRTTSDESLVLYVNQTDERQTVTVDSANSQLHLSHLAEVSSTEPTTVTIEPKGFAIYTSTK
ncbi:glycoside hydrolase family 13 protein [Atopobacter phocae]|uniref:glycoside hydrolase family 13 protein n=1 Tax=Atopobacter phocae TaxID=136492 RepID=UPI0004712C9C|nr:glycoside hydrolase family 13 protein [Atopobacter phocae]